jgi:membrane protease YdiL (CAAX protease family)
MQRRQLIRIAAAAAVMLLLALGLRDVGLLTGRLPRSDAAWSTTPIALWLLYLGFVLVLQTVVLAKRGMMPGLRRVGPLLPRTRNERRAWLLCSVGAGVSEEIWYRAVLPAAVATVVPSLHVGGLLVVQAALFGVAHTYQRWLGVIGTTVMGYLLGVFVVATGSLWLAIAVHVVIDARFVKMPARVWRELAAEPG